MRLTITRAVSGLFVLAIAWASSRRQHIFLVIGAGKDSGQRIIVARWNRVKLMIVATSAGDGQTEKPPAERINPVVQLIRDCLAVVDRSKGEEAKRGQPLCPVRPIHEIARA